MSEEFKCLKCGTVLKQEDGVNGTDFYPCSKCKIGYNIGTCKIDDEGHKIIECGFTGFKKVV